MALGEVTQHTVKGNLIKELQSLRQVLLAGDTATTDIPVAGATILGTTIMSVLHSTAGVLVDVTSEASITSDGNLQLDTTDTTGDQLIALLYDKPSE